MSHRAGFPNPLSSVQRQGERNTLSPGTFSSYVGQLHQKQTNQQKTGEKMFEEQVIWSLVIVQREEEENPTVTPCLSSWARAQLFLNFSCVSVPKSTLIPACSSLACFKGACTFRISFCIISESHYGFVLEYLIQITC